MQRRHHEPQPLEIVSRRISTSRCRRTSDNRPLGTRCQRSAQQHSSKDRENGKPPSHCEDETAKGSNNVVSIPLGNELSAHIDSPGPRKTTQELSFPTRTPENDTMEKGKKIPTKALKDHCGIEKARFRSVMVIPASTRHSRVRDLSMLGHGLICLYGRGILTWNLINCHILTC